MRLHLGAPREPLFAMIGTPTFTEKTVQFAKVPLNPVRRVKWLYGVSWRTKSGFVFVGVQFHEKQEGES